MINRCKRNPVTFGVGCWSLLAADWPRKDAWDIPRITLIHRLDTFYTNKIYVHNLPILIWYIHIWMKPSFLQNVKKWKYFNQSKFIQEVKKWIWTMLKDTSNKMICTYSVPVSGFPCSREVQSVVFHPCLILLTVSGWYSEVTPLYIQFLVFDIPVVAPRYDAIHTIWFLFCFLDFSWLFNIHTEFKQKVFNAW